MADSQIVRNQRYVKNLRSRLIADFGGCCKVCGALTPLEWAHIKPTSVNGKGRGSFRRLRDVRKHPGCYLLVCAQCHAEMDGRTR
jgi:hypothetical protein